MEPYSPEGAAGLHILCSPAAPSGEYGSIRLNGNARVQNFRDYHNNGVYSQVGHSRPLSPLHGHVTYVLENERKGRKRKGSEGRNQLRKGNAGSLGVEKRKE